MRTSWLLFGMLVFVNGSALNAADLNEPLKPLPVDPLQEIVAPQAGVAAQSGEPRLDAYPLKVHSWIASWPAATTYRFGCGATYAPVRFQVAPLDTLAARIERARRARCWRRTLLRSPAEDSLAWRLVRAMRAR